MEEEEQQHTSGFWFEAGESETAYTFLQHRSFTQALGGLVPQPIPLHAMQTALDVGCGPGGWVLDMVKQYPHLQMTGIDLSEAAIQGAVRRAGMNKASAVRFYQMDFSQSLDFPDDSFDLVHMRSASPFIRSDAWDTVISELVRVLKPQGWLAIIDYEQGPTSSDAFNQITTLVMKAVRMTGSSLAPASLTIGAAARIYSFMIHSNLIDVSYSVHTVDFGLGNNPDAREFVEGILGVAASFKPLLCRVGLVDPEARDYDNLIMRARTELTQPDTCGYGILIATSGRKEV
jgi:ubiquinone/menaquinone biosynthesis C-methylase UbiE